MRRGGRGTYSRTWVENDSIRCTVCMLGHAVENPHRRSHPEKFPPSKQRTIRTARCLYRISKLRAMRETPFAHAATRPPLAGGRLVVRAPRLSRALVAREFSQGQWK